MSLALRAIPRGGVASSRIFRRWGAAASCVRANGSVAGSALASLQADARTLAELLGTYVSDPAHLQATGRAAATVLEAVHGSGDSRGGGSVFTTGIGKAGVVAQRLAISLASVSVPSQWVHGTEWVHGDLGSLRAGDVVVAISHSGKTSELLDLAALLPDRDVSLVAIVGDAASPLAEASTSVLHAPAAGELLNCIPSRSLIAQEAVCNMLVAELVERTGFEKASFGRNHPGGNIGQRLGTADAIA